MALDNTKATAVADAIEDLIDNTGADDQDMLILALRDYIASSRCARKGERFPHVADDYAADKAGKYAEARAKLGI